MAHGAPDHTRLSESGFAHYTDRIIRRAGAPLVANPAWETALNVNIQGVFGYMWGWCDTPVFNVRITIDGVIVFRFTIADLHGGGFWGLNSSWDKMGCTAYSAVAGNLSYGMFYDEKWGLYVHSNNASWGIYYKELI